MTFLTRRTASAVAFALLLSASFAAAQAQQMAPAGGSPPPPARIRGTIEKVDGQMLTIKAPDGTILHGEACR